MIVYINQNGIHIIDDGISICLNKKSFNNSLKKLGTTDLQNLLKHWKEYQLVIEKELFERI